MDYEIADQIAVHNLISDGKNAYEYSQVIKVMESKNLLLVVIQCKIFMVINKHGFTLGTWEECKEFMLEKCKN